MLLTMTILTVGGGDYIHLYFCTYIYSVLYTYTDTLDSKRHLAIYSIYYKYYISYLSP